MSSSIVRRLLILGAQILSRNFETGATTSSQRFSSHDGSLCKALESGVECKSWHDLAFIIFTKMNIDNDAFSVIEHHVITAFPTGVT